MQGARDALEQYGTGLTGSRLLNGTIPLHLELERELAEWMGTEEAIVFTTGHQANVGTLGTLLAPGDTVIADSGDHASILDGCLLSRAKLRAFRHNRLDKLEKALRRGGGGRRRRSSSSSTACSRWRATSRRCPRSSSCARRYGARLMVDEAHGAGVLGARGGRRVRAARRRGPRRPADGHVLEVARLLRRLHRRLARGHRLPAHPVARLPLHRRRRARRGRRRARRAADRALGGRAARCSPASSTNARYLEDGLHALGYRVLTLRRSPPRSSRCWSRTTGRPCCCGARSTTRACSSTSRCTPPCRPAARCCARA